MRANEKTTMQPRMLRRALDFIHENAQYDISIRDIAAAADVTPRAIQYSFREHLDTHVVRKLNLPFRDVDWTTWDDLLERVKKPTSEVTIALVGKYIDLPDAYLSVTEALRAGGFHNDAKVRIRWVPSDDCETPAGANKALGGVDAVLVPGGFGVRGIEGKLGALRWARERQVPTLGICLGLQCTVIEAAKAAGIPVVAYNAPYDFSLLKYEALRHGIEPIIAPAPVIDPLVLDKAHDRYRKGKRTLEVVAAHYAVSLVGAHDAAAEQKHADDEDHALQEVRDEVTPHHGRNDPPDRRCEQQPDQ